MEASDLEKARYGCREAYWEAPAPGGGSGGGDKWVNFNLQLTGLAGLGDGLEVRVTEKRPVSHVLSGRPGWPRGWTAWKRGGVGGVRWQRGR